MGRVKEALIEGTYRSNGAAVSALMDLYAKYVVDMHGENTCDCDLSVGIDTCAPCKARAVLCARPDNRKLIPLTSGEIDMVRRALRVWAHCEQEAMQSAACGRDQVHAADVARQVRPRIAAAGELMDRLLQDPTLSGRRIGITR